MKIRIPKFLSKLFNSTKKERKDELLHKLDTYRKNELTTELISYLEYQIEKEVHSFENTSFISYFQSKYSSAHSRGKRAAYRDLLDQLRNTDV